MVYLVYLVIRKDIVLKILVFVPTITYLHCFHIAFIPMKY